MAYLLVMIERVEHVVRQTGQQVDDEPRPEVVHPDDLGVGDDLAAGPDERGVEVEHDVDEEYHVDNGVDHKQGHVLAGLVLEGHVVRHHDGRVEREAQDHPVPYGLERAIVQQYVRRRLRRFLPVLGHYVRVQAHHLHTRPKYTHTWIPHRPMGGGEVIFPSAPPTRLFPLFSLGRWFDIIVSYHEFYGGYTRGIDPRFFFPTLDPI